MKIRMEKEERRELKEKIGTRWEAILEGMGKILKGEKEGMMGWKWKGENGRMEKKGRKLKGRWEGG